MHECIPPEIILRAWRGEEHAACRFQKCAVDSFTPCELLWVVRHVPEWSEGGALVELLAAEGNALL